MGTTSPSNVEGDGLQPGRRGAQGYVAVDVLAYAVYGFLIVLEDAEIVDAALGREPSGVYRRLLPVTDEVADDQRDEPSERGESHTT